MKAVIPLVLLALLASCRAKTSVTAAQGANTPIEEADTDGATDADAPDLDNDPSDDPKLDAAFQIDHGAAITVRRDVTLQFSKPKKIKRWRVVEVTNGIKSCGKISVTVKWLDFAATGVQQYKLSAVQGVHRLCVEVDAGEKSKSFAASDEINLDTKASAAVFVLTSPPQTNNRTVGFSVTGAEPGASRRVNVSGNCDNANWTPIAGDFTVDLPNNDAIYKVCTQARDLAGNASAPQIFNITLDRAPPVGDISTSGNLGPGYGPTDSLPVEGTVADALTRLASLKISVSRDSDNYCLQPNLTFGPTCPMQVTVDEEDGEWFVFVPTVNLANANYTIELFAADLASNPLQTTVENFTWYVPPPVALIPTAPTGRSKENNLSLPVTGVGVDTYDFKFGASGSTDCSDGTGYTGAFIAGATPITLDLSLLTDGDYKLCARAKDIDGNEQTLAGATEKIWTRDTLAPTLTLTAPVNGAVVDAIAAPALTLSGTCGEDGELVIATAGANTAQALCAGGTYSFPINLSSSADGAVGLSLSHNDLAGNIATVSITLNKDTGLPVVTVSAPGADGTYINNTNKAAVAVSGTCTEDTRNVVISGDASGTVVCSSGTWTASLDFTAAADGTRSISVAHSDAAGNAATPATRSFNKDTGLPTVSVSTPAADGSVINNANKAAIAVAGACSENTHNVVITGDAAATVACTAGAWSTNLNFTAAADGTASISVAHADAAGNAATPATRSFTKDTGLPTITITTPAADGTTINNANKAAVAVGGACSEDTRNVVITGDATGTVACSSGTWSTNLNFTAAADGTRSISIAHQDAAGNSAVPATRSFSKDTGLPTVTITSPAANGSYINNTNKATVAVSGACSEDTRNVVITGDAAGTFACSSGTWSTSLDFTAAADGTRSISIAHQDAAGNSATPATRSFNKDTGIPTVTISTPAADGSAINDTNKGAIAVSGTCSEDTRNVVITGDAAGTVACSSGTWSTNLNFTAAADGTRSISIAHQDAAGNSATPATRSFSKDTGLPTVTITSPAADGSYINNTNKAAVAVSGACSEDTRNVVITGDAAGTVACSSGTWSTNLDFTAAADGTRSISIAHQDASGNSATPATRSFNKDTGVPTVTITTPAADGTTINDANKAAVAVSGACSEDTRNVVITGDAAGTVACSSGTWSTSLNFTAAAEGTRSISIAHQDAAGNSATPATRSFNKDTGLPTVTVTTPAADGSSINNASKAAVAVGGACSEDTRNVVITGDATGTVACSSGTWSTNLNFTAAADGTRSISIAHQDASGNSATPATRSFNKDTGVPTVTITTPGADGSTINNANKAAVAVSGACSEDTRDVVISGDASGTIACSSGTWSTSLNFTAAADGTRSISIAHQDAAGNSATPATRSFNKDTGLPTVTVTTPAADGTYINTANQSSVSLSGACSENTRNVVVTGDASGSVACSGLAYSLNLNFTAAASGALSVSVDHDDAAGNSATTVTRSFVKDVAAPNTPAAPTDAGSYSGSTVTFNWSSVTDVGASGVASYYLQVGTTAGGSDVLDQDVGNVLTYNVSGTNGVTYYARVRAVDAAGNTGSYSGNSDGIMVDGTNPVAASVLKTPADASNGANSAYDNDTDIYFAWTAGSDAHSGLTATPYVVTWYPTNNCTSTATAMAATASTYVTLSAPNVVTGNSYTFTVKTTDNAGNFVTTACSSSITIDTTAPPALATFTGATGTASTAVNLAWTYPGSTADYYAVKFYRSAGSASTGVSAPACGSGTLISTLTTFGSTSFVDLTGQESKYFSYRACIEDAAGNVTSSNTVVDKLSKTYDYLIHYAAEKKNTATESGDIGNHTTDPWQDLSSSNLDGDLVNFDFNTANSGWDGSGTATDPYQLKFDGTNDYVNMGSSAAKAYALWFKADNTVNSGYVLGGNNTYVRMSNGSLIYFYSYGDTQEMNGAIGIVVNRWYHFVMSFDGANTCTAYLDGALIQTDTTCNQEVSDTRYLGWYGSYFDGSIATVKSFTSGLSQASVTQIYGDERTKYFTDPGVTTIERVTKGYGPTGGANVLTLSGWRFNSVSSVQVGGSNASYNVLSDNRLDVTMPAGSLGWQDVTVVGSGTANALDSTLYSATSVNALTTYITAENIDTIGTPASDPLTSSKWSSLADSADYTLSGFNYNTANSGWDGSGTPADPYRLKFDGTDDYMLVGSSSSHAYAVWFNADNTTGGGYTLGGNNTYVRMSNGTASYGYSMGDSQEISGAFSISAGRWYHLVISYDGGSTCRTYVDGVLLQTDTTCNQEPIESRYLGWYGNYFDGSIASFKSYSSSLSQADVTTMYSEERPKFFTDPGVTQIDRVAKGYGSTGGSNTISISGWYMDAVTSVDIDGNSASFSLVSNNLIDVTMPSGNLGWQSISVVGSATSTATDAALYSAAPVSTLTAFVTAENIDTIGTRASDPVTRTRWSSLTDGQDFSLIGFNYNTSDSGWDGSGTPADPLRLKFDGTNDYVLAGAGSVRSYAVWFNADNINNTGYVVYANNTYVRLMNGAIAYAYSYGDSLDMSGAIGIVPGRWYHFVMSYDGVNTCTAYLDGTLLQTDATCNLEPLDTHYLGWGGTYFDGSIASYKTFSTTLSQANVSAMFNEERTKFFVDPGVTYIERLAKGYGPTGGGNVLTVTGWSMTDVTSVQVGGASASFSILSDDKLSVTMPTGTLSWQDITVVGSATDSIPEGVLYTAASVTNLTAFVTAENVDAAGTSASDPLTISAWSSLVDGQDFNMTGFNFNTANSGWDGAGTTGDPYRLKFDGTNDYANAGYGSSRAYAVWFNADSITNGGYVMYANGTTIRLQSSNLNYSYSTGDSSDMSGSTAISTGQWYHFVMSFDGANTCTAYLNGVLLQTDATCNQEPFDWHYLGWGGTYFDGAIQSYKTFSAGLTGGQVTTMFNEEKVIFGL